MLSYLYDLIMSFVTMILGFFGIDIKKKSVSFADDIEKKNESESSSTQEESKHTESKHTESN